MSKGGRQEEVVATSPDTPEAAPVELSADWSRLGSSRTMTAFDTGVLLP